MFYDVVSHDRFLLIQLAEYDRRFRRLHLQLWPIGGPMLNIPSATLSFSRGKLIEAVVPEFEVCREGLQDGSLFEQVFGQAFWQKCLRLDLHLLELCGSVRLGIADDDLARASTIWSELAHLALKAEAHARRFDPPVNRLLLVSDPKSGIKRLRSVALLERTRSRLPQDLKVAAVYS